MPGGRDDGLGCCGRARRRKGLAAVPAPQPVWVVRSQRPIRGSGKLVQRLNSWDTVVVRALAGGDLQIVYLCGSGTGTAALCLALLFTGVFLSRNCFRVQVYPVDQLLVSVWSPYYPKNLAITALKKCGPCSKQLWGPCGHTV